MAEIRKYSEAGPVGSQVAKNLARIRNAQRKTTAQLGELVTELGIPMTASTVTKIEKRDRRVTVDELVALALALDVSPATLLLPTEQPGAPVQLSPEGAPVPWEAAWRWLHGETPLPGSDSAATWDQRVRWLDANRPYVPPSRATIQEIERLLEAREVGVGPFEIKGAHDGTRWTQDLTITQYRRPKEDDDG